MASCAGDAECLEWNLCALVYPVEGCSEFVPLSEGVEPRTGVTVGGNRTWLEHPNNPAVSRPAEREMATAE